jgi:serine/threonine protein kinase
VTNAASSLTKEDILKLFPQIALRYRLYGSRAIGDPSGFGSVWKAHDLWLKRDIALKFSNHDMSEELRLCRDIEGQTVRVFDYFQADSGWNAYAMELLETPWMSAGRFISDHHFKSNDLQHYFDCFEIARSTLNGLSHIHGLPYSRSGGFVHADIKPDNLFLMLRPKKRPHTVFRMPAVGSLVKIIDMGVSTERGAPPKGYTPAYNPGKPIARPGMDLYAVGVTFLELLTGKWPDRYTMRHKARIRTFIRQATSGSAFIDESAAEFASDCAKAASRPASTVRGHLTYLDNFLFNASAPKLIVLRAINRHLSSGLKKDDLADFLFDAVATYNGWQNRNSQRLDSLKELIKDMYDDGMLVLDGHRYFVR